MNIFVGNLSFDANEGDVKKLFEGFGNVASVLILMREEKKSSKSRGFGFVDMPDEQQALAAIAALNGKEFMGRVLNVETARPKKEAQAENELEEKRQPKVTVETQQRTWEEGNRPGTYRGGRRTHSYIKRRGLAGMQEEAKPRRRGQDNPMRWRKRKNQAKPWQKSPGEFKPWKKTEGEARPWKKFGEENKPIGTRTYRTVRYAPGGAKKAEGESKPWRKPEGGVKPWKKAEGESRPWKKFGGAKKSAGDAKPWSKSSERPPKSRFKGRSKPGGFKR